MSFLLLAAPLSAQPPSRRGHLTPGTLAITNVNVVPMTRDTVLRDVTVVVRDARIVSVGRGVRVPAGARRVDGRGKWLVPGLTDAHTHLHSDDDAVHDSAGPAELGVMVANGVTTARLMIGTPEHLVLRDGVAKGTVLGPQLWVAGPQLAGRKYPNTIVVTSADSARAAVRTVADAGYDFAGSDTPEWFHAYGFGLHRELQAFVRAGVTPYQALSAATRNAAEYLGQSREWGTIEPSKRADLVLLGENPLADVRNTERIEAVILGGRLLDRAALDAMIERAVRAIDGAPKP